MKYPGTKNRLQELAGINEVSAKLKTMRKQVAQELSQLQRKFGLSVKTNVVQRTMNGEFDYVIADTLSVSEAVDTIVDLVR